MLLKEGKAPDFSAVLLEANCQAADKWLTGSFGLIPSSQKCAREIRFIGTLVDIIAFYCKSNTLLH